MKSGINTSLANPDIDMSMSYFTYVAVGFIGNQKAVISGVVFVFCATGISGKIPI